jgi:hypothetical protein
VHHKIARVDVWSKVLFPLSYLIFHLFYWTVYIWYLDDDQDENWMFIFIYWFYINIWVCCFIDLLLKIFVCFYWRIYSFQSFYANLIIFCSCWIIRCFGYVEKSPFSILRKKMNTFYTNMHFVVNWKFMRNYKISFPKNQKPKDVLWEFLIYPLQWLVIRNQTPGVKISNNKMNKNYTYILSSCLHHHHSQRDSSFCAQTRSYTHIHVVQTQLQTETFTCPGSMSSLTKKQLHNIIYNLFYLLCNLSKHIFIVYIYRVSCAQSAHTKWQKFIEFISHNYYTNGPS